VCRRESNRAAQKAVELGPLLEEVAAKERVLRLSQEGLEAQLIAAPAAIWVGKCQTKSAACLLRSLPLGRSLRKKP
jgi:hypothetical protein